MAVNNRKQYYIATDFEMPEQLNKFNNYLSYKAIKIQKEMGGRIYHAGSEMSPHYPKAQLKYVVQFNRTCTCVCHNYAGKCVALHEIILIKPMKYALVF